MRTRLETDPPILGLSRTLFKTLTAVLARVRVAGDGIGDLPHMALAWIILCRGSLPLETQETLREVPTRLESLWSLRPECSLLSLNPPKLLRDTAIPTACALRPEYLPPPDNPTFLTKPQVHHLPHPLLKNPYVALQLRLWL